MKPLRILTVLLFSFVLTACGGGGSSSSGSGSDSATSNYVGTYTGLQKLKFSVLGETVDDQGPITIVIAADGSVLYQEGGVTLGAGTINGSQFAVSVPGSAANEPGFNCSGTINYTGTARADGLSGDIGDKGLKCNGLSVSIIGSFSATPSG